MAQKKSRKNKTTRQLWIVYVAIAIIVSWLIGMFAGYQIGKSVTSKKVEQTQLNRKVEEEKKISSTQAEKQTTTAATTEEVQPEEITTESTEEEIPDDQEIKWNLTWDYADYSKINTDSVKLYHSKAANRKNITVAVNAGHGTSGGSNQQTLCHPDGTPKVTGGSTSAGAKYATAIADGTTLADGTPESTVTLKLAEVVKEELLDNGYDVLMIRESANCQLDNIARTVFANQNADCHIALHYDSTQSDKGFFYISVPDNASYRSMEPVASHWQEHNKLGEAILSGMRSQSVKVWGEGSMALDLTQTSYSTVPSVDLEVGDEQSDYSEQSLEKLARGIKVGLDNYF